MHPALKPLNVINRLLIGEHQIRLRLLLGGRGDKIRLVMQAFLPGIRLYFSFAFHSDMLTTHT